MSAAQREQEHNELAESVAALAASVVRLTAAVEAIGREHRGPPGWQPATPGQLVALSNGTSYPPPASDRDPFAPTRASLALQRRLRLVSVSGEK